MSKSTCKTIEELTIGKHVFPIRISFGKSDGQNDVLIGGDGENSGVLIAPVVIIRVLLKRLKPAAMLYTE